MNILFLTLVHINSFSDKGIYTDLMRRFLANGHHVDVVCSSINAATEIKKSGNGSSILTVSTGNVEKTNLIKKGINTILLEKRFLIAVKKYLDKKKYDLVLYPTPPITLAGVVKYIKRRDDAQTYLMLKDIFPQNAVDLGMMSNRGVKAPIYRYFRRKEKQLYALSDRIGCMSQANVDYVIQHNPEIDPDIVEICPNSIEVVDMRIGQMERDAIRAKYGIPLDKKVFVYGGNLGKPQGIPFVIDCLRAECQNPNAFFLIVGSGTEFGKLEAYFEKERPANMKLLKSLPKEEYDRVVAACDVGMIFLDHRFTIPNFPSRMLSYMQAGLPILACTDPNTDIGQVIVNGGFGWWCESDDVSAFAMSVHVAESADCIAMGSRGLSYLSTYYTVSQSYRTIFAGLQIPEV